MKIIIQDKNKVTGGGRRVFEINGYEVNFLKSESNPVWVETIVTDIYAVLENLDIHGFIQLQEKYYISYLFRIASAFPEEFEIFIRFVASKLIEKGEGLSYESFFSAVCLKAPGINRYQYKFAVSVVDKVLKECEGVFLEAIKNKQKDIVWKYSRILYGRFKGVQLVQLCFQLEEEFEEYVRFCSDDLKGQELTAGWLQLYKYTFFGEMNHPHSKNLMQYLNNNNNIFKRVRTQKYMEKLQTVESMPTYRFKDDKWDIYTVKFETVSTQHFDFTWLNGKWKKEVKEYVDKRLGEKSEKVEKTKSRLTRIKKSLEKLLSVFPLKSILDLKTIHLDFLLDTFQQQKNDNGEREYQISTIKGYFSELKLLYEFEYEKTDMEDKNPFLYFKFHNIDGFVRKIKYIPEIVISQLEEYLHELPIRVQSAWVIMMHSGMRVGEVLEIEDDQLYYDDELNEWMFKYVPLKTRKIRKEEYHTIPAHEELIKYFNIQKANTAEIREKGRTKRIFSTFHYDRLTISSQNQMADSINNLIKKHNIRDANGKLYRYSHHQCRKSLTVSLISNGATLEEVSDFIGHMSVKTTEKSYKDLEMDKLAQLELNYFRKAFDESTSIEERSPYTKEEKEILIQELQNGSRETPEGHGSCFKHISFGPCSKNKCSSCNFLITGPQYLPKWYQLYQEQEKSLNELEMKYKEQNIEGYENFINCQKLKHDLSIYKTKILQTENTAEKVGIVYERPSGLVI